MIPPPEAHAFLAAAGWSGARIELFPERHGLLLVLLPPGAFILLGLMLAARKRVAHHRELRRSVALALGDSQA